MGVKRLVRAVVRTLGPAVGRDRRRELPPDFSAEDVRMWRAVSPYTMTSPERIYALTQAVRYLAANDIPGAFVECGVWRGGSSMAAALTLLALGRRDRDLFLFDTFEGMPAPTEADVTFDGEHAREEFQRTRRSADSSDWCNAPLEAVREALLGTGYDPARLHFVKGKVEDTIPGAAPESIALLRLDTDWYESTRHEMEHLYPRLVPGGVLIIDDYGHWQGARRAVDEYLAQERVRLLLNRIDYTGRIGVKS